MLWRIAESYEANPELRRDLHQEILLAVWKAMPRFRADASMRTYLARIAHNRGVSHVCRHAGRPKTVTLADEHVSRAPSPHEQAEKLDRRRQLLAAINQLPLSTRQTLTLTLEGFAPREIAEILGITANAVSIRLTRAKKALRSALESSPEVQK